MPKQHSNSTRRHVSDGRVIQVHFTVSPSLDRAVKKFIEDYRRETKETLTVARLYRQGMRDLLARLRVQLNKARQGVLHAKRRK